MTLPSGLAIEEKIPLAPLTSWLVGGPADYLVQPKTLDDLREAMAWASLSRVPVSILGGGTNVLISDRGVRGLTICLRKFAGSSETIENDRLHLTCWSGTSKSELLKIFLKHKLEPALFLAGLPGDVGGGIVMNAGVGEMMKPREFVELTDWIEVLRWPKDVGGEPIPTRIKEVAASIVTEKLSAKTLNWAYRHCNGWQPGIIARVGLSWPLEPEPTVLARVRDANKVRLSKQPLDLPSCGSVFINPLGHKSGQLIESSGLKGFASGGAKVSEKHANFIVNFDKAKASDIHAVIEHVKAAVKDRTGVELRTEVVYFGDWEF